MGGPMPWHEKGWSSLIRSHFLSKHELISLLMSLNSFFHGWSLITWWGWSKLITWLIGDLCLIIVFPWFFIENPMNCHWKSMFFDWTFPCRTSWCLIENHFNWWCSPMGLINFLLDGWSHLLILQHLLQADVLQLQPSSHASVVPYWFNHWMIFPHSHRFHKLSLCW